MDSSGCGLHVPSRWIPDAQAEDKHLGLGSGKHHLHPSSDAVASILVVSTLGKKSVVLLLVGTLFVFTQAVAGLSSKPSSAPSGCHGYQQPSKTPQSPTHECCALGHTPASLPIYSSDFGSSSQIVSDTLTRLSLEFSRPAPDRVLIRTGGPPLAEALRI